MQEGTCRSPTVVQCSIAGATKRQAQAACHLSKVGQLGR